MKNIVVDASVALKWYLQDEYGADQALYLLSEFVEGHLGLQAPALIDYEFINAMWVAGKTGRIGLDDRDAAVKNFLNIDITRTGILEFYEAILTIATKYHRSCYDAAYLALAETTGARFVTSDKKLFNSVQKNIKSITWIEDI